MGPIYEACEAHDAFPRGPGRLTGPYPTCPDLRRASNGVRRKSPRFLFGNGSSLQPARPHAALLLRVRGDMFRGPHGGTVRPSKQARLRPTGSATSSPQPRRSFGSSNDQLDVEITGIHNEAFGLHDLPKPNATGFSAGFSDGTEVMNERHAPSGSPAFPGLTTP